MHNLPPAQPIKVSITDEMRTHHYIRIVILTLHEYAIQISDNGYTWKTRETISNPNRALPSGVKPGMWQRIK